MFLSRSLLILCVIFLSLTCFAEDAPPSQDKAQAYANIEIGADSYERRFFRPSLRFEFPVQRNTLFAEVNYYQRLNSQVEGEMDFWIKAGWIYSFKNSLYIEASLNHFCRHITSRSYRTIFDANEVLARIWYGTDVMRLGLGGGFYIGGYEWYDNLLVFNCRYPHILQTEFGIDAAFKLINFTKVLHDLEFFISLNENLELFLRNTKHYEYKNTTYLGVRFIYGEHPTGIIRKLKLLTGYYPSYDRHKMESRLAVDLELFKGQDRRLQLSLNSHIPILNDDIFFNVFRPETIEYPLSLQYEKKIGDSILAMGYCLYEVILPVDIDQAFTSHLGVGFGLKNQPFFEKLEKRFRFSVFGGPNFSRSYDVIANFGFNTVGRPWNFGINAKSILNANIFDGSLILFGELGREIKVRIFVGGETTTYFAEDSPAENRWQFGVSLFSWY